MYYIFLVGITFNFVVLAVFGGLVWITVRVFDFELMFCLETELSNSHVTSLKGSNRRVNIIVVP